MFIASIERHLEPVLPNLW